MDPFTLGVACGSYGTIACLVALVALWFFRGNIKMVGAGILAPLVGCFWLPLLVVVLLLYALGHRVRQTRTYDVP